ncbi:MAG: hypothetical protein K2Y09_14030 [Nitrosomonas sp.]|uniref:hypothetical protein n=1 Tax=Nitrosomonas sp. TaxID=42353 RepID=UPI001D993856|nr:hypothetical protein [Nitrosomonas sp.]MBX9896264.1 hypothetical protein [Nitrosomonas sp.]
MSDIDKLKIYSAMAENTRKWISVMDTKAGFISALNAGLLGFIWTGAKLIENGCWQKGLALAATVSSFASLMVALWIVLPRASLQRAFGKNTAYIGDYKPISFYGFVASNYSRKESGRFLSDVKKLDEAQLIDEALEQHFTTSHIAHAKTKCVEHAGYFLLSALFFTFAALVAKVLN